MTKNDKMGQESTWTPGSLQAHSFFNEIWQESMVNRDSLLSDEGKV